MDFTNRITDCLLNNFDELQNCSSSTAVHWFMVLLSRVFLNSEKDVTQPCLATLTKLVVELHNRKEPLQQLLQSRYGYSERPFEAELFPIEPLLVRQGRSNLASSFSALNQLVSIAGDKEKTYCHLETLSLRRSCDLFDVEPLPFSLLSASDGTRLEKAETGTYSSQLLLLFAMELIFRFLFFYRQLAIYYGRSQWSSGSL